MNRAFRWLAGLFVAPEPENSRIAAAETAQDRRDGRLPDPQSMGDPRGGVRVNHLPFQFQPGYHRTGCLMRFEIDRDHQTCRCECHG